MGSLTPSTISSTNTNSNTSSADQCPEKLLEINIISAQDLVSVSKSMKTYAVIWIEQNRKLTTQIDLKGHTNPTWNDKFLFRLNESHFNDKSAIIVEIYTVSWLRDTIVGSVRIPVNNLISRTAMRIPGKTLTRFVALQVRRGSGTPQGILNMGVTLVDMSVYPELTPAGKGTVSGSGQLERKIHRQGLEKYQEDEKQQIDAKIRLWRSKSEVTDPISEDSHPKDGSVTNGSGVNGSEIISDVGPSASIVAAAIAKASSEPLPAEEKKKLLAIRAYPEDAESSILGDLTLNEAKAKGYRSRRERSRSGITAADGLSSDAPESRLSRRQTDGGMLSCFVCGVEFTIACGANSNNNNNNRKKNAGDKSSFKESHSQQNLTEFGEATFG